MAVGTTAAADPTIADAAAPQSETPPAYARTSPTGHRGEVTAVLSLAFGTAAIVGALFAAAAGAGIGLIGLILGTLSRHSPKRAVSTAGMMVSCVAILASLGLWSYIVTRNTQTDHVAAAAAKAPDSSAAVTANSVTTSCYTASFAAPLNIATGSGSCNMEAYNGTLSTSPPKPTKFTATASPASPAVTFCRPPKPPSKKM